MGREARVRVSVVDIQGRTMAVLADGLHRPGRYPASWGGESERGAAPAGLYFVRYETPGKNLVQRMVLTR